MVRRAASGHQHSYRSPAATPPCRPRSRPPCGTSSGCGARTTERTDARLRRCDRPGPRGGQAGHARRPGFIHSAWNRLRDLGQRPPKIGADIEDSGIAPPGAGLHSRLRRLRTVAALHDRPAARLTARPARAAGLPRPWRQGGGLPRRTAGARAVASSPRGPQEEAGRPGHPQQPRRDERALRDAEPAHWLTGGDLGGLDAG